MIISKKQELVEELFKNIKVRFPEVELINVTHSPEDPNDLWINITAPEDEDREIALTEYASELETDILLKFGVLLMIMPTRHHPQINTERTNGIISHKINFKQKELIDYLLKRVQEKFPEVELVKVDHSAEDPNDLWVKVTKPENEDREFELLEFASEISTDILVEYGYSIMMMPTSNQETEAA